MIKILVILCSHLLGNIHYVIKLHSIQLKIFAHPLLTTDTKMEDIHISIDISFCSLRLSRHFSKFVLYYYFIGNTFIFFN